MTRTLSGLAPTTNKNAHLKARRRFKADLNDIEQECSSGNIVEQGFIIRKLQAGDDEGAIEVTVSGLGQPSMLTFSLLISDTSDYPKNHVFFCSSSNPNLPAYISDVVESVASDSPRTIREAIQRILSSLAKGQNRTIAHHGPSLQDADIDDDDSAGDYEDFDPFDEYAGGSTAEVNKLNMQSLQNHFVDVVATGYRPGLLHFADDDFAISVSLPVVELAKSIPPRALMAWDRRLLSRSQHLTLLISGFRGVYPPLDCGGVYNTQGQRSGSSLTFKVGVTKNYKPGKEYARDAGRTFGLILADAEDELRIQAEKAAALEDFEYNYEGTSGMEHTQTLAQAEEHDEEGSFDRFSLSNSLESLLDLSLLKFIYLRRKFGLGWAGAELLFSIVERTQTTEDHVYNTQREKLLSADTEEAELSLTNKLPHDPLRWLPKDNEYEIIHNPKTVDLLVSIAHSAASEQVLSDPFPVGLGLRVPVPDASHIPPKLPVARGLQYAQPAPKAQRNNSPPNIGPDGMCEFDELSVPLMRAAIVALIDSLPAIDDMKKHLERKVKAGKAKPRLKDLEPTVLPAAWSILRWCVASCTAHIEEITSGEESIKNLGKSEIRVFFVATNGPKLDPGWRQFRFSVGSPDAEAKFKSANPYFVIKDTHWIICRYLLVKGAIDSSYDSIVAPLPPKHKVFPLVKLDPSHPVTLNSKHIEIPEPTYQIAALLKARQAEFCEEENDAEDIAVFANKPAPTRSIEVLEIDDDDDAMDVDMDFYDDHEYSNSKAFTSSTLKQAPKARHLSDWKHDPVWVRQTVGHLMSPPLEANPRATMAVQRELKATLKEQVDVASLKELGWFLPQDFIGDNLFQWIVEMHSFDEDLPIARDLKARYMGRITSGQ
ncbi:hypothetical protein H0H87_000151 [Tephrocybe sp. NHM501043]|nr:hypothetical protein H0H87_000151 [Tephrocybe sp. NHM501043]